MGTDLDEALNSEPILRFYDKWSYPYVAQDGQFNPVDTAQIGEDFGHSLKAHHPRLSSAEMPWGVKLPETVPMLSHWRQVYPSFKMIHVVRNGLDMACCGHALQPRPLDDLILSEQERQADEAVQTMLYWCRVNGATAQLGELVLRERYLRIRLEDWCAEPGSVVDALSGFVGEIDVDELMSLAHDWVSRLGHVGDWRQQPPHVLERLVDVGGPVLRRFSYGIE